MTIYYVKQLPLQGILDVLNSDHQTNIRCNFQVVVRPPGPTEPTASVGGPSSTPNPYEVNA